MSSSPESRDRLQSSSRTRRPVSRDMRRQRARLQEQEDEAMEPHLESGADNSAHAPGEPRLIHANHQDRESRENRSDRRSRATSTAQNEVRGDFIPHDDEYDVLPLGEEAERQLPRSGDMDLLQTQATQAVLTPLLESLRTQMRDLSRERDFALDQRDLALDQRDEAAEQATLLKRKHKPVRRFIINLLLFFSLSINIYVFGLAADSDRLGSNLESDAIYWSGRFFSMLIPGLEEPTRQDPLVLAESGTPVAPQGRWARSLSGPRPVATDAPANSPAVQNGYGAAAPDQAPASMGQGPGQIAASGFAPDRTAANPATASEATAGTPSAQPETSEQNARTTNAGATVSGETATGGNGGTSEPAADPLPASLTGSARTPAPLPSASVPALSAEDVQRSMTAEIRQLREDMSSWHSERAGLQREIEGLKASLAAAQAPAPTRATGSMINLPPSRDPMLAKPTVSTPPATGGNRNGWQALPNNGYSNSDGQPEIRAPRPLFPAASTGSTSSASLQPLRLPGADGDSSIRIRDVYVTRPGDSLTSIGRIYNVSPDRLRSVNGLKERTSYLLPTGLRIKIPE